MNRYCNKVLAQNNEANLINVVNEAVYSKKSRQGANTAYAERVANAFGYTSEQLQSVPDEAHIGFVEILLQRQQSRRWGETVVDLGAGGGIDVFLAAAKVDPTGQVIGLDNSDDMIARARLNAAAKGLKPPRVAFMKATLTEDLPIENDSVDCVLSDCVTNLLPPAGKLKVMEEVYRILKPGGRVSIDDIIAKKPFPDSLRSNVALYVGCISGAILLQEYKALIQNAGFKGNPKDLTVYGLTGCCGTGCCGTSVPTEVGDLNEWAKSYNIYATKSDSKPESALKIWWDAYPSLDPSPGDLECEEVADLVRNPELSKKDFVVVDTRRDDHAGGRVHGSVRQPAQAYYDDLLKFYEEYKETKQAIFHCMTSGGRSVRCAKWYQDYLDQQGNTKSKAFAMTGGVKKWVSSYKGQEGLVDFD